VTADWSEHEIVHFAWNITSQSWPYGTSLLVGLDTEFEILEELETHAKDYMEKQAWPYEVLQLGDNDYRPTETDVSSVKSKWKNRDIGENIITTYPSQLMEGGTGGAPIRELSNILDFLKDNIVDGIMVPPISKQYNATEASAKVMMPHAHATLITPMQRLIRRKIESEIYRPFLEDKGYSVRVCPKILFEPPDAHREEDAEYFSKLCPGEVIIPPAAIAKELGYEEEYEKWSKEKERKEQEQMEQQQAQMKAKQEEQRINQAKVEEARRDRWRSDDDVWEVRRKARRDR